MTTETGKKTESLALADGVEVTTETLEDGRVRVIVDVDPASVIAHGLPALLARATAAAAKPAGKKKGPKKGKAKTPKGDAPSFDFPPAKAPASASPESVKA